MIQTLGFQLVLPPGVDKDDPSFNVLLSLETLPQFNTADVVILFSYNFSDLNQLDSVDRLEDHQLSSLKQAWEKNSITQSLDASQAEQVHFIPVIYVGAYRGQSSLGFTWKPCKTSCYFLMRRKPNEDPAWKDRRKKVKVVA
ncbi:MAG: hypothetical protein F6K31_42510 [Symploca sp. SIO2G7]|nr:hypothetical protein [Symploca sp. SIO2G7]